MSDDGLSLSVSWLALGELLFEEDVGLLGMLLSLGDEFAALLGGNGIARAIRSDDGDLRGGEVVPGSLEGEGLHGG